MPAGASSPLVSPSSIHPVEDKTDKSLPIEECALRQDFGVYQILLLFVTQLSYFPVAASMLSTSFLLPSKEYCNTRRQSENGSDASGEFHSLLFEWGLECSSKASTISTSLSVTLMSGAFVGSILAGFISDRYGRRPVVIGSLLILGAWNLLLLVMKNLSWSFSLPVYFLLGTSTGGYMTTNLVLIVEMLRGRASHLLVVALNGWSLSLAATGGLAFFISHFTTFHSVVSFLACSLAVLLFFISDESLAWLSVTHRKRRFWKAAERLAKFNGYSSARDVALVRALSPRLNAASPRDEPRFRQGCSGLLGSPRLRRSLFALCYMFCVNSVVSFGFYINVDKIGGNKYANMAIMGVAKFVLGLLPFVVSRWLSRRIVAILSVATAALSACSLYAWQLLGSEISVPTTLLSLTVVASLDPTWKVLHLYSTQLFPTHVRSTARGICNAAARGGSVVAPAVLLLRELSLAVPYGICAAALCIQLAIFFFAVPDEEREEDEKDEEAESPSIDSDGEMEMQSTDPTSDSTAKSLCPQDTTLCNN